MMDKININNDFHKIEHNDFAEVCENYKKRVFKILYLKDDLINEVITEYDFKSYINALKWDMYGAYKTFGNYKFLNCICELEGIKENIFDEFARKKVLDLGGFIGNIHL